MGKVVVLLVLFGDDMWSVDVIMVMKVWNWCEDVLEWEFKSFIFALGLFSAGTRSEFVEVV